MAMWVVIGHGLSLLQDQHDKQACQQLHMELVAWDWAVHSHPLKRGSLFSAPGVASTTLFAYATYAALSSLMCQTALQQLQGERELGDWSPVQEVRPSSGTTQTDNLYEYMV